MKRATRLIALSVLVAMGLAPAAAVAAGAAPSAARAAAAGSHAGPGAVPGGTELWVQRFTGRTGRSAFGSSVAASPDGSVVYVTGTTGQQLTAKARAYTTVAYDAATGAMLWQAHFQGTDHHPFGGFDSAEPFIKVTYPLRLSTARASHGALPAVAIRGRPPVTPGFCETVPAAPNAVSAHFIAPSAPAASRRAGTAGRPNGPCRKAVAGAGWGQEGVQ